MTSRSGVVKDAKQLFMSGRTLPMQITAAIAVGSTNQSVITFTLKDADGNAITTPQFLVVWLSAAATGIGIHGTAPSVGLTVSTGTQFGVLTTAKAVLARCNASGVVAVTIEDASKTTYYVGCSPLENDFNHVTRQLVTGDYG